MLTNYPEDPNDPKTLFLSRLRLHRHCAADSATVPFFLLTVFCFANSSQKLHDWFIGTKMYRKHLEFFVRRKDMTRKAKASIPTSVISLMGLGFFFMARKALWIPCGILAAVWLCHLITFSSASKPLRKR